MRQNIEPPDGGRIHIVSVWVDESHPWEEALVAGCQQTASQSGNLRQLSFRFSPRDVRGYRDIFLVNFGREIRNEEALMWAWENDLIPVTPRAVFAVMQNESGVIQCDLGPSQSKEEEFKGYYMGEIVSLDVVSFRGVLYICYVWWDEHQGVNAEIRSVLKISGLDTWFAFARGG